MGDMEILESNFKLADAQELVAQQTGSIGGRRSYREQMP